MNKTQLVDAVVTKAKVTKAQAEAVIAEAIKTTIATLKKGEEIRIGGFGTLVVKKRAARKGVNPGTGKAITIPASKTVTFKASKTLKETL